MSIYLLFFVSFKCLTFIIIYGIMFIMKNIIITDAMYRSSLAAVQSLKSEENNIIVCQTDDYKKTPLSFKSRYVSQAVFLHEENYMEELLELVKKYENPVILPVGAKTVALLSGNRETFEKYASFLIPSQKALADANDKKTVARAAREAGIPTPAEYGEEIPEKYPVIVKPYCGEKFGLHAEERYIKANNRDEYLIAIERMKKYDNSPIVQECIEGEAVGVCIIMDKNREPAGFICHKRIREYPITGGPSTCCKTIYDPILVKQSVDLLKKLDFCGIAMVEYKGGKLLEINPRVWGSFPLTFKSESNFTENWVNCSLGLPCHDNFYKNGVKMKFTVNDTLAALKHLSYGHIGQFFSASADILNPFVKDGVFSLSDPSPFFTYIKNLII